MNMAPVLVQKLTVPSALACPLNVLSPSPPHHSLLSSHISVSEPEYSRETQFLSQRRETESCGSCNRLNLYQASMLPQRPFGEPQRSRQDVAGGGAMKPELNHLKQPKYVPKSLDSSPPSPVLRSTTLEQASVCNTLCPSSHVPSNFLPHPLQLQDLDDVNPSAHLRESEEFPSDEEPLKRSLFSTTLAVCAAVQLVRITGALSFWVSRLRLRYFDSPFTYCEFSIRSKLGRVGIFWDIENCPVPGSIDADMVVKQMHRIGAAFGTIQCLRAYGKLEYLTRQAPSLLRMGVELCPVPDGKESADKAIIMDALLFAFDHKPCPDRPAVDQLTPQGNQGDGIVIVTGDRGFVALIRELSNRQITTVVIGNGHQKIPPILAQAADFSIEWDEMMENRDLKTSLSSSRLAENSTVEDKHLEFGGWAASSSCNVYLQYESRETVEEEGVTVERSCCDNAPLEEGDSHTAVVGTSTLKQFDDLSYRQEMKLLNMAASEEAQGLFFNSQVPHQDDESSHETPFYQQSTMFDPEVANVTTNKLSGHPSNLEKQTLSSFLSVGKGQSAKQPSLEVETSSFGRLGTAKKLAPVGGRVRILRHLRCEIAFVVEKHCKGKPTAVLSFEQFELLYELEMGHALVSSYYGFASLKSLLQSMPDIVSLCSVGLTSPDWRIFPYVKRNNGERKARTNYSRQDLRCILYKILHSVWPHGVAKDQLSSEHCNLTGRPLVLVAYEYWKLSDVVQSMSDMIYTDATSKRIYLVDSAPEPQGFQLWAYNAWI